MGIVKNKPADLKPENDLDNIPDDALGLVPAVIQAFGTDLLIMDKPPQPGQVMKIEITVRCKDEGRELLDGGDFKHYRKCKKLGAVVSVEPYEPEAESEAEPDDETPLLNRDGTVAYNEDDPDDGLGEP